MRSTINTLVTRMRAYTVAVFLTVSLARGQVYGTSILDGNNEGGCASSGYNAVTSVERIKLEELCRKEAQWEREIKKQRLYSKTNRD